MERSARATVISAYGDALQTRRELFAPDTDLPCTKDLIRKALIEEFLDTPDLVQQEPLIVGYMELEYFVPGDDYEITRRCETRNNYIVSLIKTADKEVISAELAKAAPEFSRYVEILRRSQQESRKRADEIKALRGTEVLRGRV